MSKVVAKEISVNGVVQAVGFRPFVYRIAVQNDLSGWVKNLGDAGVQIVVRGDRSDIDSFLHDLRDENPPLARVDEISVKNTTKSISSDGFEIRSSASGGEGSGTIPPDIATCSDCLDDVFGESRYEGYWATSCVNCGPRFTVIRRLPYDRPRTSMDDFPMCDDCREEYTDPLDRRYHAQTIACPQCGPRLWFSDSFSDDPVTDEPISAAASDLRQGRIVAIKGLGGSHLACDATDDGLVKRMRSLLGRPRQPFALMGTEEMVLHYTEPREEEWQLLTSPKRPIVTLPKSVENPLPQALAPGLHTLGFMLPYTALHSLLFSEISVPLVMTSANMPGQPMLIHNDDIQQELSEVADGFLLHDRTIVSRCDDSVLRFSGQRRKFLRRSRGWVPSAISVDLGSEPLLSLGAEQDNVIGLYVDGSVYLSQYLGDIDDLESLEFLKESLDRLLKLTDTTLPSKIAHDLHPKFLTTDLAQEQGDLSLGVQHHHAHLGSLLAETSQDQLVGIILDGVGFSENGEIWGGEILTGEGGEYQRVGSLTEARMPGGDLATLYPARMVAGILYPLAESGQISNFEEYLRELDLEFPRGDRELAATVQQLESDVNAPLSTSAGRFLDAVSALLGICSERTYEGEPPMKLESVAREGVARRLKLPLSQRKGRFVLDQSQLFYQLVEMRNRVSVADLAATAQSALARGFAALAIKIAEDREIDTIGLSGGVSYNDSISSIIESEVKDSGYSFTTNKQVPHGDGGLALGQLWVLAHSEKLRG